MWPPLTLQNTQSQQECVGSVFVCVCITVFLGIQLRAWLRWNFLYFLILFWSRAKPNTCLLNDFRAIFTWADRKLTCNAAKVWRGKGGLRLMLMLWVGMCIAVHIGSTSVLFLLSALRNNMMGSSVHKQTSAEPALPLLGGSTLKFICRVNIKPHIFSQTCSQTSPLAYKLCLTLHSSLFFDTPQSSSANSCIIYNIPLLNGLKSDLCSNTVLSSIQA